MFRVAGLGPLTMEVLAVLRGLVFPTPGVLSLSFHQFLGSLGTALVCVEAFRVVLSCT